MSEETYRFNLGAFRCLIAISDGTFTYPPDALFADLPPDRVAEALREHGLPVEQVTTPYTCLLIDTGSHRVLVDTGAGGFMPTTGHLVANLRAEGLSPEDIDTVILTHGHADHIGGVLTAEGTPAFPKARYVMWKGEWDFWTADAPDLSAMRADDHLKGLLVAAAHAALPPLRGRLDLVDRETEIVPGIRAIAAPGHTPGHMALSIASGDEQLLDIADAVLHPLHMAHPEWYAGVDTVPERAVATKRLLLDRAAAEGALTLAFHFPFPGLGRVTRKDQGWQWEPVRVPAELAG